MNKRLSTVIIETDDGPVVINEADYDADVHTLADGQSDPTAAPAEPTTPAAPAEPTGTAAYVVQSEGNKHYIADADGMRIKGVKGVATKGYSTPADAWAAIMALNTSE